MIDYIWNQVKGEEVHCVDRFFFFFFFFFFFEVIDYKWTSKGRGSTLC